VNEEQRQESGFEDSEDFEEQLRELLAEDAYTIRPSPAPYSTIRRKGVVERRRQRVAAAGAALVTLVAVPAGAYALSGRGTAVDTGVPRPSLSASQRTPTTPPSPSAAPSTPARPATSGQLLDGISFAQAASGLEKCIGYDRGGVGSTSLGKPADYRILLAMRSTGDSNAPGDGYFVVAVKEKPTVTRLICTIKGGEASGLNTSTGDDSPPDAGPVSADINSGKLYQESVMDRGNWTLPFRWGIIGTVKSSVAKVTVSYGDSSGRAVLDHGWFVATGMLHQQVTNAPHIKGYDTGGKLVYDSDHDKYYAKTLP
jgi:hypothetical protein